MARSGSGSLLQQIKDRIANAGKSRKAMFYVKDGQKRRVRFLRDMEEGLKVTFHDKYQEVNTPCLKQYGKVCEFCDVEGLRTRDQFAWPIYDYEAKEQRILMFAPNSFSPIPQLIEYFEVHGKLTDRDYTISRRGSGTDTSYAVIAGDRKSFKLSVKPFSDKKMMALIWDANGPGNLEDFEDEDDEAPRKKKKKQVEEDDDYDEDDEVDDEEDEEDDSDDEDFEDEDDEESDDDEEDEELPRRKRAVAKKSKSRSRR